MKSEVTTNPYIAAFEHASSLAVEEFRLLAAEHAIEVIAEMPVLFEKNWDGCRKVFGDEFLKRVELHHLAFKAMKYQDEEFPKQEEDDGDADIPEFGGYNGNGGPEERLPAQNTPQISQEQNEAEEQLCLYARCLARMGVKREDIINQIDLALQDEDVPF